MSEEESTPTPKNVGGQAVMEGVMMRAPGSLVTVVRRRSGELTIRERSMAPVLSGPKTWPFLRGGMTLFSSLKLGMKELRWSASLMEADLLEEERQAELALARAEKQKRKEAAKAAEKSSIAASAMSALRTVFLEASFLITSIATFTTEDGPPEEEAKPQKAAAIVPAPAGEQKERSQLLTIIPFAMMLLFFWGLPQLAAFLINGVLKLDLSKSSWQFQAITGAAKLAIIVGYMSLLRLNRETRRFFQYHGAEHKAISTYEHDRDLVVDQAKPLTTLHARCGTTFLIMVAVVSVVIFSAVGAVLPEMPSTWPNILQFAVMFVVKLPLIPVVAGITYEIQRVFARYCMRMPLRVLLWPGFAVQKITTAEPETDQLEIALASLRAALAHAAVKLPDDHPDRTFPTYESLVDDPFFEKPAAAA
ncbi:MAG: DUF1385 domain-containing protein [Polyangiaceae bacterium]